MDGREQVKKGLKDISKKSQWAKSKLQYQGMHVG